MTADPDEAALDAFRGHMDDDLGTPGATALLFELVGRANAAFDEGDVQGGATLAATVAEMVGALGLALRVEEGGVDEESARLVAERDQARASRDYARADAIRDRLEARGWSVKDTPEGTRLGRRAAAPGG